MGLRRPNNVTRRNLFRIAVIARTHLVALSFASGTMLGLTLCGSSILRRSEAVVLHDEFRRLTAERTVCVRQQIEATLFASSSVSLALGAPECGKSENFDVITAKVMRDHPEILALAWTGDVAAQETLPLAHVVARESIPDLRHLDLRGSTKWSQAVDQSIARNAPTFAPMDACDPAIQLERRWVFVPVENPSHCDAAAPSGFVAALIDLGQCVEESRHGPGATPAGIDMYLMETGEHVIGGRIHAHPSGTREKRTPDMPQPEQMFRGVHEVEVVQFGGRSWVLLYAPAPIFAASRAVVGSRLLMLNGIVCALVCVGSGLAAGWFTLRSREAAIPTDPPAS